MLFLQSKNRQQHKYKSTFIINQIFKKMKKLFSLALVFFTMLFAANAQVTVILEAHNVWGDGSGYQMLLDADHDTYGTTIPTTGALTSSGNVDASVYAEFEYKIPANADGNLSTQNMVYDGSVTITIPAGTYDYCITNPTPGDRMWIASDNGPQSGRGDDFVFVDGNIYHFTISRFGSNDGVTLTVSANPTSPTIDAPATVNFGTVLLNNSSTMPATVNAYLLTSGISAVTTAPFEISADGTTFGTTATLPQAGGTLYVKYTPTSAGSHNGTVILSSTGADNDTIVLSGNCVDCSNTSIPYSCNFTDASQLQCWTVVDANADNYTFSVNTSNGYAYYRYNSSSDADDYLISPVFNFTGTQSVLFDYWAGLSSYPEIFEVFAIGADTVRLTQPETVSSTSSLTKTLDLAALNGDYSIAFHCISEEDQYYLYITNFQVIDASSAIVNIDADTFNYGTLAAGTTLTGYFNISTTNLNEAITVSTNAPFEVSLNDTTYNTTLTIPADTNFVTSTRVYVRFAPTAAGTFSDMVLVTTSSTADTLVVMGNAVECEAVNTFPFVETFDAASETRVCWEIVDNNNDGSTFTYGTLSGEWVAAYQFNSSNAADDYLISPEIALTSGLYGHIDYACYSASYPEKMSVYVIPANGTLANAVNIVPEFTVSNPYSNGFETLNFDLAAYANQTIRIAIKASSDADMYLLLLDNFTIEELPAASMAVTPTSMTFNGIVNTLTSAQTATVSGTSLTNDITVTVTGPFEVSTNGTAFAATATIAQASIVNAPLYVRMNATTAGAQNGTVTLTSGSNTATITLTGNAIECNDIASLPFNEDFEGGMFPPTCWNLVSLNEKTWEGFTDDGGNNWAYVTYAQTLQNEKLITKSINFSNETNVTLTFDFMASYTYITSTDENEQYNLLIYASTDNGNTFSTTPVYNMRNDQGVFTSWEQTTATVDLSSLAGQPNVQLMFNYYGTYGAELLIDNIHIQGGVGINDNENNVSIYPNPANNVVNVNATSNINNVEIFNMMGQKVAAFDANDTNVQISTTALSNGMYMMRITTENGVSNQKFTVAR